MSHFTTLKTKFVAVEPLIKALDDVRAQFHLGAIRRNAAVSGWRGNTTTADLVLSTRHAGYDLGFRKQGETFELVADWYGITDYTQEKIVGAIAQRYAYHAVREQLSQQGFALVEEETTQEQAIHLVLRRTV